MHLLAPQLLCPEIFASETAFCMAALLLKQPSRKHFNLLISHWPVTANISGSALFSYTVWNATSLEIPASDLCPGSSVFREKTGIIKLWALWQEWRGRSWIMLHLNLSGEGPRKGPRGRKRMAATIGKSKPNESRSFPDPSTPRDAVATHLLPHPHSDNLSSSAGFHSANVIASDWSPTMYQCLLCQYLILPPLPQNPPSQANIWKNSDFFWGQQDQLDNVKDCIIRVFFFYYCSWVFFFSICHCVCCHSKNHGERMQRFYFPLSTSQYSRPHVWLLWLIIFHNDNKSQQRDKFISASWIHRIVCLPL